MGYERIQKPEGLLYHYTRKENLESILRDGRIRKFCDRETWFTKSLADTLRLMSLTVMQEGAAYYDARGRLQRYPAFVPEDYVVLELTPRYQSGEWVIWNQELPPNAPESVRELAEEFSHLKLGYRGDLKFWENPVIYEMTDLLEEPEQTSEMKMQYKTEKRKGRSDEEKEMDDDGSDGACTYDDVWNYGICVRERGCGRRNRGYMAGCLRTDQDSSQ